MKNIFKLHVPISLYKWGWLGIVPLIGGISGFFLLLQGIFKFKDIKLSLIGIAGISFTLFFYIGLLYFVQYSDVNGKAVAKISIKEMNSLVKYIEYYRLQNGRYPDNLLEINKTDKFAPVFDPLMLRKEKTNNNFFNYKTLGEHYILFSSGIDKVPYTSDDLYPDIPDSELKKTGLLRTENK